VTGRDDGEGVTAMKATPPPIFVQRDEIAAKMGLILGSIGRRRRLTSDDAAFVRFDRGQDDDVHQATVNRETELM